MLALIDGDIVVHRIGFTTENEDFGLAKWRCNEMIEGILAETGASEFLIYLSDKTENGFRKDYLPTYKANRTHPKPKHYDALKEYLIKDWEASITVGQEADDALGISQIKKEEENDSSVVAVSDEDRSVICSIDKDLLQIPGMHYNFVKKEWKEVNEWEGMKFFYAQLLIGDVSDNVKGVWNIGEKKAAKILQDCKTESDCFQAVVGAYHRWLEKEWSKEELDKKIYESILRAGIVLKIRQKEEEIWSFPKEFLELQPTLESLQLSTPPLQEETIQSTELTGTE